jgi:hypothetical protein
MSELEPTLQTGAVARETGVAAGIRASLAGGVRTVRARLTYPPPLVHALVPVLIGAVWLLAIKGTDVRDMTDVGLVSVLPRASTLLLFALTASFVVSVAREPLRPAVPLVHVLVLVTILYGVTAFLETEPRFSSVYRHAGIIDYISQHHAVDPGIDAYFSWPGFFVLGAFITDVAGFGSVLDFASWGPLVFNLLFLVPLVVIFRWASRDRRVTWAGLWIFYSTNWVGQDYVSPQAVALLLWLAMLGVLLTSFVPHPAWRTALPSLYGVRRRRGPLEARFREWLARREPAPSRPRTALLLPVVLLYAAMVTGHQLTPFPAVLTVAGLVLFAGLATRGLPVLMAVVLAAWISYMTTTYLIGHYSTVAGPVGSLGENLNQNVSGRLAGSTDHQLIVHVRIYAAAAIWALAVLGFARRVRFGAGDVALAVVAAAPFLLPVLQPYGGEIVLRVFLLSLPAVAYFIARLVFPSPTAGRSWPELTAAAVVGCALLLAFQYTRYGNERLDHFTTGDVATVHALYRVAPIGTNVVGATDNLPWRYRHYADYRYYQVTELDEWQRPGRPDARVLARQLERGLGKEGGYLIITRSTRIDAELRAGRPGILEALTRVLRGSHRVREIYRRRDGSIFLIPPPGRPDAKPAVAEDPFGAS